MQLNRLSAHVGYLYRDLHPLDRIAAAARDGFCGVEMADLGGVPATDIAKCLSDNAMEIIVLSAVAGNPAKNEKGLASLVGREVDFRVRFMAALDEAETVGARFLHPMAGIPDEGSGADDTYRRNLEWALRVSEASPVSLLVEAITLPGYHVSTLERAIELQNWSGGRLSILFDTYHAAKLGQRPAQWIERNASRIGHVHIADFPGRHEPGTGDTDFGAVLFALASTNYRGAIGFEYLPKQNTGLSLSFIAEWRRLLASATFATIHTRSFA